MTRELHGGCHERRGAQGVIVGSVAVVQDNGALLSSLLLGRRQDIVVISIVVVVVVVGHVGGKGFLPFFLVGVVVAMNEIVWSYKRATVDEGTEQGVFVRRQQFSITFIHDSNRCCPYWSFVKEESTFS